MTEVERLAQRLALHLGTTSELLTMGVPAVVLQQQLLNVRSAVSAFIALEIPNGDIIQVTRHMTDDVAEALSGHVIIPDDISDIDR